jgi:hypothetical protein
MRFLRGKAIRFWQIETIHFSSPPPVLRLESLASQKEIIPGSPLYIDNYVDQAKPIDRHAYMHP